MATVPKKQVDATVRADGSLGEKQGQAQLHGETSDRGGAGVLRDSPQGGGQGGRASDEEKAARPFEGDALVACNV